MCSYHTDPIGLFSRSYAQARSAAHPLWLIRLTGTETPTLALFDPRTRSIIHRYEDPSGSVVDSLSKLPLTRTFCTASADGRSVAFAVAMKLSSDRFEDDSGILLRRVDAPFPIVLLLSSDDETQQVRVVTVERRLPLFLTWQAILSSSAVPERTGASELSTWFSPEGRTVFFRHCKQGQARQLNVKFQQKALDEKDRVPVASLPISTAAAAAAAAAASGLSVKENVSSDAFRKPPASSLPEMEPAAKSAKNVG